MAAHLDWTRWPRPQDRSGARTADDRELRNRFTPWTERCCIGLLGGDDAVGLSWYRVVCPRNSNFFLGHSTCREPSAGFHHSGCMPCLWSSSFPRSRYVSPAATFARECSPPPRLLCRAPFCRWAKIILPGSPPWA